MNRLFYLFILLISLVFQNESLFAQMGGHGQGHMNPDSLTAVTVNGTAIVDTNFMHPMYFLDTDNNGDPDYFLNFGPYWYEPDSSNAARPNNGDQITIAGGLWENNMMNESMIIVYEINGQFWRDPYNPFWNEMGHHGFNSGHEMDSCHNVGFGWQHDPPQAVTVSGYALVDTTFMMAHYYLDEDNDGTPEYFLNFGPPWYEPNSGATRPENGDQIDIVGGLINNNNFPMVIVYEINGQFWRDSTFFGGHMGSGWINRNMTQPVQFNTPFDENDWMEMLPGWWTMGGGGHHGGMQDSLFCQIFEIVPGQIFELGNENAFAGYEVNFFSAGMMGGMGGMGCGEHMQFASNANFQFHYTDEQLSENNILESSIQVKYWNTDVNSWVIISNPVLNSIQNTISFSNEVVGNFFILTGNNATSAENISNEIPSGFSLDQNYPNPFNPSTTIRFSIPQTSNIKIEIYDVLGNLVKTLIDYNLYEPGSYEVVWNGLDNRGKIVSSGIYFTKMQSGNFTQTMKMNFLK